jgi:hypothetical protein
MMPILNRRGALGAVTAGLALGGVGRADAAQSATQSQVDSAAIADTGWALWLDRDAKWQDDTIYLPADVAANNWHQVPAGGSNGLLIDGDGIEIVAAYSRDHDRQIGASSFTVRKNGMKLLFHRMPDMAPTLQTRWIINALHWLSAESA